MKSNNYPTANIYQSQITQYSCPVTLNHNGKSFQQIKRQWQVPFNSNINNMNDKIHIIQKNNKDIDYEPQQESQSQYTSSQFFSQESTYDPLANLDQYMKMRDKL